MMLTKEHLASHDILEMIQILEKRVDDKITENRELRKQLNAQEQQCLLQAERIIEMNTKIQSLEELEIIDAGEVINLEWDEVETPIYHIMELAE